MIEESLSLSRFAENTPAPSTKSAVEHVSRKLLPLTLARSQIGEAGLTLQLVPSKMTSGRCLDFFLLLISPPLCGVEAGNSVVHRGDHQN